MESIKRSKLAGLKAASLAVNLRILDLPMVVSLFIFQLFMLSQTN